MVMSLTTATQNSTETHERRLKKHQVQSVNTSCSRCVKLSMRTYDMILSQSYVKAIYLLEARSGNMMSKIIGRVCV